MSNKKRFFFLSYSFTFKSFSGSGDITFDALEFPSKKNIVDVCKDQIKLQNPDVNINEISVVILNWIEMNERDHALFCS